MIFSLKPLLSGAALAILAAVAFAPLHAHGDGEAANAEPLGRAFAHNDYYHPRPLFDALSHGFNAVEADIFRVEDELKVAHTAPEIDPDLTLRSLYLDPIRELVEAHGAVHPGGPTPFWLMIDIKSDASYTWPLLNETLSDYEDMLTVVRNGELERGPVRVVISGNRPIEEMAEADPLYAGVDGRLGDLGNDAPPAFMPWISDHWNSRFSWDGVGSMPEDEAAELAEIVGQAHEDGRMLRFWATPEEPDLWQKLLDHDVDLINTDDLAGLEAFLRDADE